MKMRKTSSRRLLYLLAIVMACTLGLIYSDARIAFYKAYKASEKIFLSTHLKKDTETLQMVIYKNYNINHEQILRTGGNVESFLGVCRGEEDCRLLKRYRAMKACKDIISNNTFDTFRVYHCWTKPNLEFTNLLKCSPLTFRDFEGFCELGRKIAMYNNRMS